MAELMAAGGKTVKNHGNRGLAATATFAARPTANRLPYSGSDCLRIGRIGGGLRPRH